MLMNPHFRRGVRDAVLGPLATFEMPCPMPPTDPNCIFCKIVRGEVPSLNIWETEEALAFLDIGPLAEGHLLVIPKSHYANLGDMPGSALSRMLELLPKLAGAVRKVTGATGHNILQNDGRVAGQAVDHVHFHIIPRREGDGLGYRWLAGQYKDDRGRTIQEDLLQTLKSEQ